MVGFGLGLGFGTGGGARGKVYIADGLADFGASIRTISGTASYPNDDYQVTGSGTQGTTTFTRSGGDPLSDLGSEAVFVAMEDASGNLEMNVTYGFSGSDVTLLRPLGITATSMHQAHQGANEQHLSPKGSEGQAQWILSKTKQECYQQKAIYSTWCGDIFTNNSNYNLAPSAGNLWKPYGGTTGSFFAFNVARNLWTATALMVTQQSRETIRVATDAAGEGANLEITASAGSKYMLSFTVGGQVDEDTDINVQILHGGVEVLNDDYNSLLRRIYHVVDATSGAINIDVRITRTNSGTAVQYISIGGTYLCDLSDIAGMETDTVIAPSANVLLLGDSWYDADNVNGAPFDAEFRAQHSGTVNNEAIGGSQITDWKGSVSGWLSTYDPDICVIHTGINEINASMTAATFWGHMKDVINTITARGVDVLINTQGCTASASQTLNLAQLYNEFFINGLDSGVGVEYADRWPKLTSEFIFEASANEFTNSASVINLRNKVPGTRVVERLSDNVDLTPTGTAPADAWEAV